MRTLVLQRSVLLAALLAMCAGCDPATLGTGSQEQVDTFVSENIEYEKYPHKIFANTGPSYWVFRETDSRHHSVDGAFKNNSNRTIIDIGITAHALDADGKRVYQYPCSISKEAIPPGYSRQVNLDLRAAPKEWNGDYEIDYMYVVFEGGSSIGDASRSKFNQ